MTGQIVRSTFTSRTTQILTMLGALNHSTHNVYLPSLRGSSREAINLVEGALTPISKICRRVRLGEGSTAMRFSSKYSCSESSTRLFGTVFEIR